MERTSAAVGLPDKHHSVHKGELYQDREYFNGPPEIQQICLVTGVVRN